MDTTEGRPEETEETQESQSMRSTRGEEALSGDSSLTSTTMKARENSLLSFFSATGEYEDDVDEEAFPNRLAGSFAASSSSLSGAEEKDPLHLLDEAEQEERVALASTVQTAMQRLCRLAYSIRGESVPFKGKTGRPRGVRKTPQSMHQEAEEKTHDQRDRVTEDEEPETEEKDDKGMLVDKRNKKGHSDTSIAKNLKRTHVRLSCPRVYIHVKVTCAFLFLFGTFDYFFTLTRVIISTVNSRRI